MYSRRSLKGIQLSLLTDDKRILFIHIVLVCLLVHPPRLTSRPVNPQSFFNFSTELLYLTSDGVVLWYHYHRIPISKSLCGSHCVHIKEAFNAPSLIIPMNL